MGILDGKRLLITGVLTPESLAFHVATAAQAAGAELVLSSFGRMRSLTERTANRLEKPVEVVELDVNDEDHLAALAAAVKSSLGGLDGALHAIAFAPEDALGGKFLSAPRPKRRASEWRLSPACHVRRGSVRHYCHPAKLWAMGRVWSGYVSRCPHH